MHKKAKLYLTISLALVVLGVIATVTKQAANHPLLYVFLPIGAVFFGLFLVSTFLADEADQHDKDQEAFEKTLNGKSGKA